MMEVWVWAAFCGLLTPLATYALIKLERKVGFLAPDVHKPNKPLIPRTSGPAFLISTSLLLLTGYFFNNPYIVMHSLASITAGLLGLYDDLRGLNAFMKVALFTVPGLIIALGGVFDPHPYIPVVGGVRITILYPLLLIVAYTVITNAYNMIDTHNGITPFVALITAIALLISTNMNGPSPLPGGLSITAFVIIALLTYLPFNLYPAKIFNGNAMSFMIGSLIASQAILLRREFLLIMLSAPLILNGFGIISSIKGFKNKEAIPRPVTLTSEFKLKPSKNVNAPITLVQLLTLSKPLSEKELIIAYYALIVINAVTSLALYQVLSSLHI